MTTLDSSQWMYASGADFYSHSIDQSLRFEDGSAQYLYRTPSSGGNQRTWTWSAWHKKGNLDLYQIFFMAGTATATQFRVVADASDDKFQMYYYNSGNQFILPNAVQRDTSAWYHVVFACDTTQATSSNRLKLYINGEQVTSLATENQPSQNYDTEINRTILHTIGRRSYAADMYLDGYLADVNFIDGQQLDPTYFGETKAGIWIPKDTSGLTFGTNGFRLQFQDSSSVGDDTSGNGNDFTASGFAATDVVLDSPTNNWCTLNPLFTNGGSTQNFKEGNLKLTADSNYTLANGTFAMRSGKWYWETLIVSWVSVPGIGITRGTNTAGNSYSGYDPNGNVKGFGYDTGGWIYGAAGDGTSTGATLASGQTSFTTGDVMGCSFDADAGELKFYKNNTLIYTISSINEHDWKPSTSAYNGGVNMVNFGQDSSFAGNKTAQGNADGNGIGDFYYSPPSGFLALCSANLPDPAIDPAQDEEPADYFNTVLYTGNGTSSSDTQAISGVGFSPDFTWIKSRTDAAAHILNDRVRGAGKNLFSHSDTTENVGGSTGDLFTSFDSDGFTVNYEYGGGTNNSANQNAKAYVAWNWLAGGSASSNSNGSITSSVSANTEAGFSIVGYVGNQTAGATVGHGLSKAPEVIIAKNRDSATNWMVYHAQNTTAPETEYLGLNLTQATFDTINIWNDTAPTSSVFSIGGGNPVNQSSNEIIAYCFHSVDGYSKFGSYTGNGSSDGPFVYTGFRVAWLLNKSATNTSQWALLDAARDVGNPTTQQLFANLSNAEGTSSGGYDFLSNGFKIRDNGFNNTSGQTYIYLAFAEQPFKYSNAR